jgi:hypothetical protein
MQNKAIESKVNVTGKMVPNTIKAVEIKANRTLFSKLPA